MAGHEQSECPGRLCRAARAVRRQGQGLRQGHGDLSADDEDLRAGEATPGARGVQRIPVAVAAAENAAGENRAVQHGQCLLRPDRAHDQDLLRVDGRDRDRAPQKVSPEGFTRQEAIVGGFVGVTLHEAGHAVNDLLNLPVLGREEDAADQIAGFIMLQFGKEVARTAIKGTAYSWLTFARQDAAGLLGHAFDAGATLLQFPLHRLRRRPGDVQGPRRQVAEQGARRDLRARVQAGAQRLQQDHHAAHRPGAAQEGADDPMDPAGRRPVGLEPRSAGVEPSMVIPGRAKGASPESIIPDSGNGFRARPFGPSRNDDGESGARG